MQEQYTQIGETAGKIYRALEQNGASSITKIQKEITGSDVALFHQSVGWLAREGKVEFQKNGKAWTLALASNSVCS